MSSEKTQSQVTYDLNLLSQSIQKWEVSPGLRYCYGRYYDLIQQWTVEGSVLELGSGIGVSKKFIPQIVTSDVVKTPYVDCVVDAYSIRKGGEEWSNITAIDVLHHLCRPVDFLRSASNALTRNGRIVLIEPANTLYGSLFYQLCHHEPMRLSAIKPPFEFEADNKGQFANMAMGYGMFVTHRDWTTEALREFDLEVTHLSFCDFLAYPLTGGYSMRQLLPNRFLKTIAQAEAWIPQVVTRWTGLRMCIVLSKI